MPLSSSCSPSAPCPRRIATDADGGEDGTSLFGVLDGHGGRAAAREAALHRVLNALGSLGDDGSFVASRSAALLADAVSEEQALVMVNEAYDDLLDRKLRILMSKQFADLTKYLGSM